MTIAYLNGKYCVQIGLSSGTRIVIEINEGYSKSGQLLQWRPGIERKRLVARGDVQAIVMIAFLSHFGRIVTGQ